MNLRTIFQRCTRESTVTPVPGAYAPHCDSAVLHAPGECAYCDLYPAWQEYRKVARIAFTGHEPKDGEVRCPAEQRRALRHINRWGGNVAHPASSHKTQITN